VVFVKVSINDSISYFWILPLLIIIECLLYRPFLPLSKVEGHSSGAVVDFCCVNGNNYEDSLFLGPSSSRPKWQHVISVGRDKRCLIQDFARYVLILLSSL